MKMPTIGVDLAKQALQVYRTDEHEKAILKKWLFRSEFRTFMANLPPYCVGMEVCGERTIGADNFWPSVTVSAS
ncbi:MAG: hypothetical protein KGO52_14380 [Nitrospirota bacterium]|nr:hypothetical protein [Nitrospirota bacterium]